MEDSTEGKSGNDKIVAEANDRFKLCQEYFGSFWQRFLNDMKFRHGDSDNGWQWHEAVVQARGKKPCLTLNIVRQHNFQISNSAKQRKSSIKIIPTGGPATQESANIYKGLVRDVEYRSRAQDIYGRATELQVDGGLGWWRIITEYCDDDSMELNLRLLGINDSCSVMLDPDAQEKDKRDAKYGFVFDLVPKKELEKAYPRVKNLLGDGPLMGAGPFASWIKTDHIWVAEYFRKVEKKDELLSFVNPQDGIRRNIRASALPGNILESVKVHPLTKTRPIYPETVEWYFICGDQIADKTIWPGKFIPLIPVLGEETYLEGDYDCKGHTRAMKDPQRMYNYNASAQVEFVALQGKTPWVAAAKAIEGHEAMWQSANVINHAVMIYNGIDEDFPERPIPPPVRTEPPVMSAAYQAGMETAFNQMMMTSGQWQNQMGMMGNERTGVAIQERNDQGENSTFHFQDNLGSSLRYTGEQLLDLFPKVLTTKRIQRILAEDGEDLEIEIDPSAKQAYVQHLNHNNQVIKRIFNPQIGTYGVAADVGPSYGSKQRETADKLTLVLTQAPTLVPIIGDLLLSALDFDQAQEAARRLKRMIPPQALGKGPSEAEQQMQQQISALQVALAKTLEDGAKKEIKLVGKAQDNQVDVYNAETARFKALADSMEIEPEGLQAIVAQLVGDALATHLSPITQGEKHGMDLETAGLAGAEKPPVPGARKAADGEWYVANPQKPGKYLRVKSAPKAQAPAGEASNAD